MTLSGELGLGLKADSPKGWSSFSSRKNRHDSGMGILGDCIFTNVHLSIVLMGD